MASALAGPTFSSTRSMVAASAVLMLTFSAAKALPARASASNSEWVISLIDFMTVSLSWVDSCPGLPGCHVVGPACAVCCAHQVRGIGAHGGIDRKNPQGWLGKLRANGAGARISNQSHAG